MIALIKKNISGMYAFVIALFVGVMFLTFDRFCYTTITTETPLLKIGNLPMLRMDFTVFLFAITAIVGVVIGILLLKKLKRYSPVFIALIAAITLFIALFDIRVMQILAPDMRISHVAMSLSRLSAIALGVSGLFAGIAAVTLASGQNTWKYILCGILTAVMLSIIAVGESLYTPVYICVSIAMFAVSILGEFVPAETNALCCDSPNTAVTALGLTDRFLTLTGLCILVLPLSAYLVNTLETGTVSYIAIAGGAVTAFVLSNVFIKGKCVKFVLYAAAVIADVLLIFFAERFFVIIGVLLTAAAFGTGMSRRASYGAVGALVSVCAVFIGAILSYVIVHDISEVIKFSNNRIVYAVKDGVFILLSIWCVLKTVPASAESVIMSRKDKTERSVTNDAD